MNETGKYYDGNGVGTPGMVRSTLGKQARDSGDVIDIITKRLAAANSDLSDIHQRLMYLSNRLFGAVPTNPNSGEVTGARSEVGSIEMLERFAVQYEQGVLAVREQLSRLEVL